VRSRDLVAVSRDLFVSSKDCFVNFGDLLVMFDPTNGININNRLLLPIYRALGLGGEDFCPFSYLLTWLALRLTLSHLSSARDAIPTAGTHRVKPRFIFL
jgi:hypothetical protein